MHLSWEFSGQRHQVKDISVCEVYSFIIELILRNLDVLDSLPNYIFIQNVGRYFFHQVLMTLLGS